jgi:translation elongation factor EF-1alpha
MPLHVSGIHKITVVGDVITGRVEQGSVKPGAEVVFLPTHTKVNGNLSSFFDESILVADLGRKREREREREREKERRKERKESLPLVCYRV